MSVNLSVRYDVRPYSGYDDPGLPIAAYIAQGGLAGDASGGIAFFDIEYMMEQEELITESFNIEQVSVDTDSAANQDVVMQTINMDSLSRNRPASNQKWAFSIISRGSALGGAMIGLESLQLPLWLGSPNGNAPANAGVLRISFVNVDLRLYAVTIQGYIWGPRSILAVGGPRRPVGGLFT